MVSLIFIEASLAQSVERAAFNRTVVGSSPTGSVFLDRMRFFISIYDISMIRLLLNSFNKYYKTVWPSGLRRVTRNHFSSGGVGSNPAAVVI